MEEVPLDKLEKVAIKKDFIEKMDQRELNDFLNGFRSQKLYTVNASINDENYRIPAKIRLQQEGDEIKVRLHPIQRLHIPDQFMGHTFTSEEKTALLNDRNIGRVIELQDLNGKKDNYFIGVDPKTNEIIPLKQKNITLSDSIKGVSLSESQKQTLMEGGKVSLDGMTGKNDKKFSATLQVDPAGRTISFSDFKQEKGQNQKQDKTETVKKSKGVKVG
nr:DUF3945 domain-containing protein [uncultured Carboxylicivirga sp.]